MREPVCTALGIRQFELPVHWPAICIGIQTGPYKTDTWVLMTREQPRARCSLCGGLEPRGNNSGSAERAKRRRLEDKAEMERIKGQNAMLQTRAADVEARFAALASEYNKLQLQRLHRARAAPDPGPLHRGTKRRQADRPARAAERARAWAAPAALANLGIGAEQHRWRSRLARREARCTCRCDVRSHAGLRDT